MTPKHINTVELRSLELEGTDKICSSYRKFEPPRSRNFRQKTILFWPGTVSLPIYDNWCTVKLAFLGITLFDKVCQWLAAGLWFSSGTPVFSTNKTYRHNIAEILLKVALNTITLTLIIRTRSTEKITEERTSTTVQQNKRTKACTDITNRELHQLFQKWQSPNSQKSVAKYIFLNLHYYSLK